LVPIAQEWLDKHPSQELPEHFVTSMSLSAEDHIRVQAVIQTWVDSSISKTANCPEDFTVEETARLYELAFELGCKGVTIYRDGSRDVQVLSTEKKEDKKDAPIAASVPEMKQPLVEQELSGISEKLAVSVDAKSQEVFDKQYKSRPQILRGATYKVNTPFGMAYITINDLDGIPSEIFLNVGKAGSDVFAMSEALGRVCSLFLRYGDHGNKVNLLVKHLKGIGGSGAIGFGVNRVESIADAVAKSLELHSEGSNESYVSVVHNPTAPEAATLDYDVTVPHTIPPGVKSKDICPSCGSISLVNTEGCKTCTNCGYSKC
jgi:ribonucleoside-diphosphate reductase alpha chain